MKKGFSLAAMTLAICMVSLMAIMTIPALADQYERVVFSNAKSGAITNTAAFFNAKVLSVRVWNLAGATITNTIAVNAVTPDFYTNNLGTFVTTGTGYNSCSESNLYLFKNDVISWTASTNAAVEVMIDSRSR